MITIVLAAGGTAGHVYPAVALAEQLAASPRVGRIVFVGARGAETDIVPRHGFELVTLPARPFARTSFPAKLGALAALAPSTLNAFRLLRRLRATAVIGFGGYAAVAPVIAGRLSGAWTAIHEANANMGIGNRLAARWARRVYVAHPEATRATARTTVIGMPVRAAIVNAAHHRDVNGAMVLVMTGTERSRFLETRVPPLLNRVRRSLPGLRVIHQTAAPSNPNLKQQYAENVDVTIGTFFDPIAPLYEKASVAIVRPGASSIAELATCGIPTIVVPDPTVAAGHHDANARLFAARGGVLTVTQQDWDEERVAAGLMHLLTSPEGWSRASSDITRLGAADAARLMAADILSRIDQ
jgi:UDP-N-acetylglucosamine--N-acetylmuramyl-(pentapeptide) pyrophosphoryl-undecaprenol N-acetylglucosamine transferase